MRLPSPTFGCGLCATWRRHAWWSLVRVREIPTSLPIRLRHCAAETGADLLIKATKVDGVYDKDPQKFPEAKRFERLTIWRPSIMQVQVMDSTALTLAMDNRIPIVVLNLWDEDSLERLVSGAPVGTFIGE